MSKNKVEVLLTARDEISGTLKGLVAGFTATLAGLAVAGLAVLNLKSGIEDAAKVQTSMVVSAGDVGTLMGVSYGKALSTVKDLQAEISKMAASLPGETSGYASIANSITATLALSSKGNLKTFKEDAIEITRTLGLLAATKGADMNQAGGAANKFLSGSQSFTEAKSNDIFEKNPIFFIYLKDALKSIGKQEGDWQKLSQEVRNKTFKIAGKKAFTTEMLSNLDGTADSLIQGIKSGLFDAQTGVFGFMRELKGLGNRTALNSVQDSLKALMFVSDSGSKFLAKYGLSFDPMEIVARGFDFATQALNGINQVLSGNGMSTLADMFSIFDMRNLKKIDFKKGVANLSKFAGSFLDGLRGLDTTVLADGFNSLLSMFAEGLKNFDAAKTGQFLADLLSVAFTKSWDFTGRIDWGKLYQVITDAIAKLINTIAEGIASLGGKVGGAALNGLGNLRGKAAKGIDDAGNNIFNSIQQVPTNIMKGVEGIIGSPRSALPSGVQGLPTISNNAGNTVASNTFAPVIQVSGVAQNLQETADYVLSAMNSRYMEYRSGILT